MTNIRLTAILIASALLISCNDTLTNSPDVVEVTGGTFNTVSVLVNFWDASQEINIAIDGSPDQAALETAAQIAADNWNNEMLDNFSALPSFDQVGNTSLSKPRVWIDYDTSAYSSGSPRYCGNTELGSGTGSNRERVIHIEKLDSLDDCSGPGREVIDLAGVIAHEFAKALGVKSVGSDETEWCVGNVPDTGDVLNKIPCTWEQQLVYDGYGVRADPPANDVLIVKNLYIQGSATDTVSDADTLDILAVAYAGPEPSQPAPRDSTVKEEVLTTWSLTDSQVVEIISQTDSTISITSGGKIGSSYLII